MKARWLVNEWRLLRVDATLWATLALALTLGAFAIASGAGWLERRAAEASTALTEADATRATTQARLEQIEAGRLDPAQVPSTGLPTTVATTAVLPPGPLAAFSIGHSDLHPSRATIQSVARLEDVFRFYQVDNPSALATGRFDFGFLIVFLAPLLVIALTYNVLAADRDGGTLALILSQPVSAARLAWSRTGLRVVLLTAVFALIAVAGHLILHPDAGGWRLLMWVALTTLYLASWASAAVWIAAFNRSSDFNLLALLVVWLALTLVVPALANLLAQTVAPTPSRLEYVNALRSAEIAANAQSRELLRGYLLDHPEIEAREEGRIAPFIKTYYLVQRDVEAATAPVRDAFTARYERQQALLGHLSFLSPAMLLQASLDDLAGTSLARQRRFEAEAIELRARFQQAVEPALMAGRRLAAAEHTALPHYEFVEERTGDIARRLRLPVGALLLYIGIVAVLAGRRLRRFAVSGGD
jgi:ABC-2 type transport system permease protein